MPALWPLDDAAVRRMLFARFAQASTDPETGEKVVGRNFGVDIEAEGDDLKDWLAAARMEAFKAASEYVAARRDE